MDSFLLTLLYWICGIVIVIFFLCYIIVTQKILKMVLYKSAAKIIPRSEVPEYLTKFYEIKESQLLNLGFTYQYCIFTEKPIESEYPHLYIFVYYNSQKKTYATLIDNSLDNLMPFLVRFETHFKNDKKLVTSNGLDFNLCKNIPNIILKNAYAETLEKHFQFHLHCLAEVAKNEGEVKEFDSSESEQTLLKKFNQKEENYFNQLLQQGITYKLEENKYGIKTLASLGIAYRFISDLKKKKITQKSMEEGMVDIPVELDLANYQNARASLTTIFKNTSGKIFFFLLLLVLFVGVSSLIGSFEIMGIIVAALLLHEIGHWLAMRLMGFKDLKIMSLLLFGIVDTGSNKGISPFKKVIGYFAGPIPGIVIGFLLLLKFGQNGGTLFALHSPLLLNFALVLLISNYISLLPVKPFVGGQIFNSIRISQFPFLRILFYLVCIVGFLLAAVFFSLLIYVAIFIGIGLFMQKKRGNITNISAITKTVKEELKTAGPIPDEEILKKIFLVLKQEPYRQYSSAKKFQLVPKVKSELDTPEIVKPSAFMAAATLIFYLFIMAAPIVYLLGPSLFNAPWLLQAVLSGSKNPWNANIMPCNEVIKYKPEQGMLSQVSQADFERLPAKKISNNSKVMRSCLFYPVNTGSTVSSDKPKAEARAPFANDTGPGIFLAKLTALYGKPDEEKNCFSYTLVERKTGIIFHALLEQGIMAMYAGQEKANEKLIPLCYRFEALLKNIAPVDCNYVYKSEFGCFEFGVSNGQSYTDLLSPIDKEALQKKLIVFPTPASVNLLELSRVLTIYRAMFAIGHDRWLSSEASMNKTVLEVTGLPAGLTKEQQLELFPVIKEWLGNKEKKVLFNELKFPRAEFMNSGVYPDPAKQRLLLIQGFHYTQDEVRLAHYLSKVEPQLLAVKPGLTVEMEFLPGDYGNPGDLKKYYLYLKGNLILSNPDNQAESNNSGNFEITGAVGPINTLEKIGAWIEAAKFFAQFEEVPLDNAEYRLELNDEKEAKAIKQLCQEVTEGLQKITIEGKYLIGKNSQAEQLGLIVTYHRYAGKVLNF